MGKGDKKSKKGKRFLGSYGVSRSQKKKTVTADIPAEKTKKPKPPKEEVKEKPKAAKKETAEEKPKAAKKEAAEAKPKAPKKEAAEKKPAAAKAEAKKKNTEE